MLSLHILLGGILWPKMSCNKQTHAVYQVPDSCTAVVIHNLAICTLELPNAIFFYINGFNYILRVLKA